MDNDKDTISDKIKSGIKEFIDDFGYLFYIAAFFLLWAGFDKLMHWLKIM